MERNTQTTLLGDSGGEFSEIQSEKVPHTNEFLIVYYEIYGDLHMGVVILNEEFEKDNVS
jgi:hypothetical protein